MKKALAFTSGILATLFVPLISFAQTQLKDIKSVGGFIISTINDVFVPVLFAVAFIVFVWGAFETFILGAGSEEVKEKGKNLMLWGLIGFFVMVSVWGLVNILTGSVGFGGGNKAPTSIPAAGGVR